MGAVASLANDLAAARLELSTSRATPRVSSEEPRRPPRSRPVFTLDLRGFRTYRWKNAARLQSLPAALSSALAERLTDEGDAAGWDLLATPQARMCCCPLAAGWDLLTKATPQAAAR